MKISRSIPQSEFRKKHFIPKCNFKVQILHFGENVLHFEIIELWRFSGNILAILKKIIGNTIPRWKNVTR